MADAILAGSFAATELAALVQPDPKDITDDSSLKKPGPAATMLALVVVEGLAAYWGFHAVSRCRDAQFERLNRLSITYTNGPKYGTGRAVPMTGAGLQ